MRVMVLVKANKDSEAGIMPKEKLLVEMGKFNDELVKPACCWPLMASSPARKANAFGSRETSGP